MEKRQMMIVMVAVALSSVATSAGLGPVVPFDYQAIGVENSAAELRRIRAKTGLKRFALTGPGFNAVMYGEFPDDLYARIGDDIASIKHQLEGTDITLSWWCSPAIRYWSDFPPMEDAQGRTSVDNKKCPLDPAFAADFTAKIRAVAERCHPEFILIEDDYTMSWSRGLGASGGCYCARHLDLIGRICGRRHAAAEIWEAFCKPSDENRRLRAAFGRAQRETLSGLAARVRRAVDEVDPSIRFLLCEGSLDRDGDAVEAVTRAFAGSTRPALRPRGSVYSAETSPSAIPGAVAHAFWTIERLPRDIETFYETDAYPHNRFFSSASFLTSLASGGVMAGSSDIQFYCLQYLDDPLEDPGYVNAYARLRPRLERVKSFVAEKDARLAGVRLAYTIDAPVLTRSSASERLLRAMAYAMAKFGIPYTTRVDAKGPTLLVGEMVRFFSNDDLNAMIAGGLFLDAPAAVAVMQRGLGDRLGIDVRPSGKINALGERILPTANCRARGCKMNASFIFNAGAEGSSSAFAKLKPGPKGEALSVYCDRDGKELAPSFVYGENDDGGRSAALAVQLPGNRTSSLFNLRKQELIRRTFSRLAGAGGLPIAIENAPGIWILAAVSADGREMMVMANNLSGDVRNDLRFVVGGEWQGAVVSHVGQDGGCVPMGKASGVFAPGITFEQMVPEFFLFVRPYEVQPGGSVRSPDGKPESVGSLVSHVS